MSFPHPNEGGATLFQDSPLSPEAEATIAAIVRRARETAGCPEPERSKAALLEVVRRELHYQWRDDRLEVGPHDQFVFDLGIDAGAVDVTIFHANGWVSVIDCRVGDWGVAHVGQGLREVQIASQQVALKCASLRVRQCLLWSSTGSAEDDAVLEVMCERLGVVPLSWAALGVIAAVPAAVRSVLEGAQQ